VQVTGPRLAILGGIPGSPQRPNESQTPGVSLAVAPKRLAQKAGDFSRLGMFRESSGQLVSDMRFFLDVASLKPEDKDNGVSSAPGSEWKLRNLPEIEIMWPGFSIIGLSGSP